MASSSTSRPWFLVLFFTLCVQHQFDRTVLSVDQVLETPLHLQLHLSVKRHIAQYAPSTWCKVHYFVISALHITTHNTSH